ncbi:MAG: phenylacetate--CoA ligase family protein [Candidatus Eisenbacteria bacterium]
MTYDAFLRRDGYSVAKYRKALNASQYLSPDELAALQWSRLLRIVRHAYDSSPFYRERFRRVGFEPEDLRSPEDLRRLPILTKDDLRSSLDSMFATGFTASNTIRKRTGGSTGVPVRVHMDYEAASQKRAAVERHDGWAGWRPGVPLAAVWGDTEKSLPWRQRLRNTLSSRANYLDTLVFTEERLRAFLDYLCRSRVPVLMGHAHSVYRLAQFALSEGITPPVKAIITTAMSLSSEERTSIEEAFRASVFNRYGCEEVSLIASECDRHSGLHVFAEGLLLEFQDNGYSGVPARLIITDLLNFGLPLLRYDIGDYVVSSSSLCTCGRGLPLLKDVSGRVADFLYTPEGTPIFGISVLDTFVIHIAGVRQAQLEQLTLDSLVVRIVRNSDFSDESLQQLEATLRRVFGPRMRWDVEYCEQIGLTPAGKYRFSICRINEAQCSRSLMPGEQ